MTIDYGYEGADRLDEVTVIQGATTVTSTINYSTGFTYIDEADGTDVTLDISSGNLIEISEKSRPASP